MLLLFTGLCGAVLLSACTDADYYIQCASGHLDVMRRCRPIDDILTDQSLPDNRRTQLAIIRDARNFASSSLGLPDNGSYRKFADLGRPYAVWNVVAAPEFSLQPKQWCFPIAGCVSYRGYFDEAAARKEAAQLAAEGYDTDVYGVQAYSTLNWFDDPVLNTFLDGPGLNAVALVFHELAHQVVYVTDDSRFNEAFATTVEQEGISRWLGRYAGEDEWRRYREQMSRGSQLQALLRAGREKLATAYEGSAPAEEMRRAKRDILFALGRDYADLKASWDGYGGYDAWMSRGFNNARLASLATYQDLVPAFQGLLATTGGDLPAFYRQVKELSSLPSTEQLARLDDYAAELSVKR